MDATLERHFERIGARVRTHSPRPIRAWNKGDLARAQKAVDEWFAIDVQHDKRGEIFDLTIGPKVDVSVTHADADDRHLLLLVKVKDFTTLPATKSKFLCGHDERHWFAAPIPESEAVGTVAQAKRALQPSAVRVVADAMPKKLRSRRRSRFFLRQGEWFFVPATIRDFDPKMVLRDEPLTRGRGKPHMAEFVYRFGGETVYVGTGSWLKRAQAQRTLSQTQYNELSEDDRKGSWRVMRRDAEVYAKGRITHADHATLELPDWCRVYPNTESASRVGMRQLAFID